MRVPPISVTLGWPTPNYVDPITHGPALLIVNIIFIAIVLVAVTGRFYARIVIKKWFGIDDGMCALALFFTLATAVVVVLANERYGWSRHLYDIPMDMFRPANIVAFVAKITFTLAATFTRLSLICFYYRLIKDSGMKGWFPWVLHASVLWTISVCAVFVALTIWLCDPVYAYWAWPPSPNAKCLDEGKVMLGGGIVNSASDLLTTVLPIPIVMRLQMPLRQRIGVCVLLCLGMIVTIAGALRTYFTWKSLIESWDETWFAYPLWICAAVEIDLGLGSRRLPSVLKCADKRQICSCAPAWKILLQRPIQELTSKLSSLRSPSNSPNSSQAAKASIFNPLRSLPWFQIRTFDFERRSTDEFALQDVEKAGQDTSQPHDSDDAEASCAPSRPVTPALHIEMRRSVDQKSLRLEENPVLPGEWLSDGHSRRTSPRRT